MTPVLIKSMSSNHQPYKGWREYSIYLTNGDIIEMWRPGNDEGWRMYYENSTRSLHRWMVREVYIENDKQAIIHALQEYTKMQLNKERNEARIHG